MEGKLEHWRNLKSEPNDKPNATKQFPRRAKDSYFFIVHKRVL